MFVNIPKGFIPDQDTDQLTVITEAAQGTSYYQMVDYEQQIAQMVADDPNVESLMASVGGTHRFQPGRPQLRAAGGAPQAAQCSANWASTTSSRNCAPSCAAFAGMKIYLQNPPTIRIGGQVTKSLYQFSMQSTG